MSEIEKMYKTIFGEFVPNCRLCAKLIDCEIINNTHNCNKFECDYKRLFTAEKQIELIKWLGKRPLPLLIGRYKGKYYLGNSYFNSKADSFDNAIATRINDLWQDLTDAEKAQIKEILE